MLYKNIYNHMLLTSGSSLDPVRRAFRFRLLFVTL